MRRSGSSFTTSVRFDTRAEHEAALDETDRIGPCAVPYDAIVPPLRLAPEGLLAACRATDLRHDLDSNVLWATVELPTHRVDGRCPYKAYDHMRSEVARIGNNFIL